MSDGHGHPPAPIKDDAPQARRARAIEALLVEKGVLTRAEIREVIDRRISRTPADGARVVARAWTDPAFKERLLANAKTAVGELGYDLSIAPELIALENTDEVHHVVVCTLCSCYPRALLGPPPAWYKSLEYRSRTVNEPRTVLGEFGLELKDGVAVRVVDSTADVRYLVLPRRPAGTEKMSEEELAALVSRDSMIGVTEAKAP